MNIEVKKLSERAVLPVYQTKGSVGADLCSCIEEDIVLKPMDIEIIPTGLSFEIPEGYEVQIRPRSGLSCKGITVNNSPGTIDSDYRGEIKVILINLGKEDFVVHNHDRIAQMVVNKVDQANLYVVDKLTDTERGSGGFGSTGIKSKKVLKENN